MKTSLFFCSLIFLISTVNAQFIPTPSMQSDFKEIAKFSGRQNGYEAVQTYSSGNIKGSQFFFQGFTDGSVTTTNNEVLKGIYQFLFDKVRQEFFIISKSDKRDPPEVLLAEKSQVKSFTLLTDRDHLFVPARTYDPANTVDFYEVLEKDDSGYTLLKSIKTTFVKFDNRDIEKIKRGDFYDEFVDKITYYISYKSSKPQSISLKKRNMINAFPEAKKAAVQSFQEDHSQDDVNEQYLINLVQAVNK